MLRNGLYVALVMAVIGGSASIQSQVTDCSHYNITKGPFAYANKNTLGHVFGYHGWSNKRDGECSYAGTAQVGMSVPCDVHSVSNSTSVPYESQSGLINHWHTPNADDRGGDADGPAGGTAMSGSEGAFSVSSCVFFPCAAAGISISGNISGIGLTLTISPQAIWKDSRTYTNTCTAYTLPPLPESTCPYPTSPAPYPGEAGTTWNWDPTTCSWYLTQNDSPVIIDTKRTGFKFSDPTKGRYVTFDIKGDGNYKKFSWPIAGSGNGWLVYVENDSDVIRNGTQLFGNFTKHSDCGIPHYQNPNGFCALAVYDENEDEVIDRLDSAYNNHLRIWIDEHCYRQPDVPCVSWPGELHPLEKYGIWSISLVWDSAEWTDAVGNVYAFNTLLNPDHVPGKSPQTSKDNWRAVDVSLASVE